MIGVYALMQALAAKQATVLAMDPDSTGSLDVKVGKAEAPAKAAARAASSRMSPRTRRYPGCPSTGSTLRSLRRGS